MKVYETQKQHEQLIELQKNDDSRKEANNMLGSIMTGLLDLIPEEDMPQKGTRPLVSEDKKEKVYSSMIEQMINPESEQKLESDINTDEMSKENLGSFIGDFVGQLFDNEGMLRYQAKHSAEKKYLTGYTEELSSVREGLMDMVGEISPEFELTLQKAETCYAFNDSVVDKLVEQAKIDGAEGIASEKNVYAAIRSVFPKKEEYLEFQMTCHDVAIEFSEGIQKEIQKSKDSEFMQGLSGAIFGPMQKAFEKQKEQGKQNKLKYLNKKADAIYCAN